MRGVDTESESERVEGKGWCWLPKILIWEREQNGCDSNQ